MERLCIPFLVAAAFVGASALSHGQDAEANAAHEVGALREEVALLKAELEETRALVDETVAYLARSSKSAAEMATILSESEAAGFTFGINPLSREILLAGWRKELAERQKGLPGTPQAPPPLDPQAARRSAFRR